MTNVPETPNANETPLNERDANELVNEIAGDGKQTSKPAWNANEGWQAGTETELSLGLTVAPGPELGEHVFALALQQRQDNMKQAVIDYVSEEMRVYAALQAEQERTQKAMVKCEARLRAIKAGEFSINSKTGAITFNDKELKK